MIRPALVSAASGSSGSDRGVIHEFFRQTLGTSDSAAHSAQIYLDAPFKIALILVIALILTRLVNRVSRRIVNGMRLVSPLVQTTPRGAARVQTLAGAFGSVFRALIWIIALLEVLNEFSINLAPFVATATVIGAAVGFGAQSLVKDFLSGILILAEDQYGVGDHIAIGTGSTITAGTVESVNLRVTRLRGADGGILYVPNGDIRTLSNDTETDSQALVDVVVPYGTDLVAAGVAAQEAAQEMAADPEWSQEFVGEPYFAGVQDATSANGVTLRIMALTRPGQHLRMSREMRMRIVERLRRHRIAWAGEDAPPAELPPETEVRKARAAKRRAEKETAAKLQEEELRPAKRGSARKRGGAKAAAAKAAVARRVGAGRRPAEPVQQAGTDDETGTDDATGAHGDTGTDHETGADQAGGTDQAAGTDHETATGPELAAPAAAAMQEAAAEQADRRSPGSGSEADPPSAGPEATPDDLL